MAKTTEYVTIALPKKIVNEQIDPCVESGDYSSRTELVKDALRDFFAKNVRKASA